MSAWIWVLIPLVAIIGGYIIDYQKNKLKWQNQTSSNEADLEEIKVLMQQMKKRIENLEAIAVYDTGHTSESTGNPLGKVEINPDEERHNNKNSVAEKAARKQKG